MVTVNLLPSSVLFARRKHRKRRKWLTIFAITVALTALPVGYDVLQTARAAKLERQTEPNRNRLASTRGEIRQVAERSALLATQIARADALRAKRPWSRVLRLLADLIPDEVWLTSVKSLAAPPVNRQGGQAEADDDAPVLLDGPSGLEISGYALSNDWLYEFMARIKQTGLFARVEMTQAVKEPVSRGDAVRFVLKCDW